SQDYLFDGTFIERSKSDGQQFISAEGGFKAPANSGQANWLAAVNLKTIVHPVLPVKFYLNFGTYENADKTIASTNKIMYEIGFEVYAIEDVLAVYFPLKFSNEIKEEFETNDVNFGDRIRF